MPIFTAVVAVNIALAQGDVRRTVVACGYRCLVCACSSRKRRSNDGHQRRCVVVGVITVAVGVLSLVI